ncbi:hypothetical protein CLV30_11982 [Haloactinopolyspora alba]|uniref:Uncharacterized protein n=1 Tax=Haloactinopolyspora alba TaxID=648780 RepID=A0A2P8DNC0_9ACTN|nr:hypothetical protein [Haloactinopolyspora alba]PSK98699.1 hypothetical protein CLV30_11982 [Haloactinopolyspora alba]
MTENISDGPGPLRHVHEGMPVLDADGDDLGTVTELKMGDAEAATTAGQELPESEGLVRPFGHAARLEPELPEQAAARLLRVGYFRVDRPMARDVYVAADQVDRVEDGTVHLAVPLDMLLQRQ